MATIQEQNLERSIDSAIHHFNKAATSIRTWQQVVDDVTKQLERNSPSQALDDVISKIGKNVNDATRQNIEKAKAGAIELERQYKRRSEMDQEYAIRKEKIERQINSIDVDTLETKRKALLDERSTLLKRNVERRADIKRQLDSIQEEIQKREALSERNRELEKSYTEAVVATTKAIESLKVGISNEVELLRKQTSLYRTVIDNTTSHIRQQTSLDAITSKLATSAKELYSEFRKMYTASRGFVEGSNAFAGFANTYSQAIKLGISPSEAAEIAATNRQAMLAVGGTGKSMDMFRSKMADGFSVQDKLYNATGSLAEAAKLAGDQVTMFALSGVKPTAASMSKFTDDIMFMSKLTGKSAVDLQRQFSQMFTSDEDMQTLLKAARSDEREQILASTSALIKNNTALGMSAEQAFAAAKMLNKMVSQKPVERIKQAAKMRALAGAMGISGGEEAYRAMIAGKRATPEQKEALDQFNKQIATAIEQSPQKGLGYEIMASSMLDKTGLESQYGPNSPFSTSLLEANKPTADAVAAMTSTLDSGITKLLQSLDWLKALNVTTGGIAALVSVIAARYALDAGKAFFNRRGGGGGLPGTGGVAGEVGEAAGRTTGRTAGKGLGKALLKKIPIIGLAAGALFGANRLMSGDTAGAVLELASGAAGTVPGLGTAASTGIDAALLARDISSNNQSSDSGTTTLPDRSMFNSQLSKMDTSNETLKSINDAIVEQNKLLQVLLTQPIAQSTSGSGPSSVDALLKLQMIKNTSPTYNYLR